MKNQRQEYLLQIIAEETVETQEQLLERLQERGIRSTQATISRDIKELRLIKTLDTDGRYRYSTVKLENDTMSSKFHSLFADAVVNIDYAGNIVVIKCLSGMAQAACAAMDSLHWDSVVERWGERIPLSVSPRTRGGPWNW